MNTMNLIVAVGCDGKNCLLDASLEVRNKFGLGSINFIDQPKKSGVYLVEVSETEPSNTVFQYKGTFKLLYHPQLGNSGVYSKSNNKAKFKLEEVNM